MTTAEMILLAAMDLARIADEFTLEDLSVRAFELYPATFSLTGYPQYLDSQRIQSKVYGTTGLIGRGKLEVIVTKVLRLTPAGRALAKKILVTDRARTFARR